MSLDTLDTPFRLAAVALQANRPAVLWGPPGVGKSAILGALAETLFPGLPFVTVISSLYDPTEFAGLPSIGDDGCTRKAAPEWLRSFREAGGGVLFLDEISTAPPATQAALLRVVLDRVVGEEALPDSVRIICAANPSDQAAGGWELTAPLANRLLHIRVGSPDVTRWADWLVGTMVETPARRRAAALISAFVRSNSTGLHALPDTEAERGGAWASPRSWHAAADCLAAAIDMGRMADGVALVAASVGDEWGRQFARFVKTADLPDPRDLLDGTDTYQFDLARPDVALAVALGVASEATAASHDPADRARLVEAAWGILIAGHKAGCVEYLTAGARALATWRSHNPGMHGAKEALALKLFAPVLAALFRAKQAASK
jgi:MoxR-like ATPase